MNALTEKLPAHDDVITDYQWGDFNTTGDLLVEYDEDGYHAGDEYFVVECNAKIVGLHLGGNFVIDRDGLCQISGSASLVENAEETIAENRISA